MYLLKDVGGYHYEDGLTILNNFEISIEYLDSEEEKDVILYTIPSAGNVVYEGQMVKVFVSKGYNSLVYDNLVNELYSSKKEYLLNLVDKYQIKLEIIYKKDNFIVDNLIYKVELEDEFIDKGDTVILTIISNLKTVIIPDFMGWPYYEVIKYASENQININYMYIEVLYPSDFIVGQSVKPYTEILKNSNPITVYLAKEN